MLVNDVIVFLVFVWVVLVVFVKKLDGMMCFCVDYRCLNVVIKKDSYFFLWILEVLDVLGGVCWFLILDLWLGYW